MLILFRLTVTNIFFSGLDEVSSYLCIKLLKELAQNGKTVVCTIHSPSARLFACFDNSYFLSSNGQCVYQGCGSYLVHYLTGLSIECPIQYNPADFGTVNASFIRHKNINDKKRISFYYSFAG